MGTHLTVPFCGRLLRGLGAHVVKVEPPGGDPLRHAGSPAAAALFAHLNAGKESVLLDADAWACPRPLEPLLRRAQIWLDGRPAATINADPVAAAVRRSPAASGLVHVAVTPFGLD
ncbi:MAG TPA: CoA transferase, partial [Dehalococcoidia bacterium]